MAMSVNVEQLAEIQSKLSLRGLVLVPTDDQYELYRKSWNHSYTAMPPVIIVAGGTSDVVATVKWCRQHSLPMTVAGGRHSRHSLSSDAVQLNLEHCRYVHVSPANATAIVGGGARNGDLDMETSLYQLATPAGVNADTGIGGLCLGGGNGVLTRKYGYTCDNLIAAQVVTADGDVVDCSETVNADLLWALRGAGFNFGVVTAMTFRLYEIAHRIKTLTNDDRTTIQKHSLPDQTALVGKVVNAVRVYPVVAAKNLLPSLSDICHSTIGVDRDLYFKISILPAPNANQICLVEVGYTGHDIYNGHRIIQELFSRIVAPLPADIPCIREEYKVITYNEVQNLLREVHAQGCWYERSAVFDRITPELADIIIDSWLNRPSEAAFCGIPFIGLGANSRAQEIDPESAAFNPKHRTAEFWMPIITKYNNNNINNKQEVMNWCDGLKKSLLPYVLSHFANTINEQEKSTDLYGAHLSKLAHLKSKYDPTNFFCFNNNILPATQ